MLSKLATKRRLNFDGSEKRAFNTYSKRHRSRIRQRFDEEDILDNSTPLFCKFSTFSRNLRDVSQPSSNHSAATRNDQTPNMRTSTPIKKTACEKKSADCSLFSLPSCSSFNDSNAESVKNQSPSNVPSNRSKEFANISLPLNDLEENTNFDNPSDSSYQSAIISDGSTPCSLHFSSSSIESNPPKATKCAETEQESIAKFRDRLQVICVDNNMPHVAVNAVLDLLRTLPAVSGLLPKDARTLLKTMRKVSAEEISDGELYAHIGLEVLLRNYYLNNKAVTEFNIFIGMDGLPLSDSSLAHFWPILLAIIPDDPFEKSYIAPIGIWYSASKTKPDDPDKFLEQFVEDAKKILENGFKIDGKVIKVNLKGLTLDTPAKSELLGLVGHGGYYACPRCKIEGVQDRGVHFPGVDYPPRGHEEFTEMYIQDVENGLVEDAHHHKYTILEQIPGIDLVKDIVYDYMHLLCIGCAKTIVKMWFLMKPPKKLSADHVRRINKRQGKIRKILPREFARKFKDIQLSHFWKATEGRQFLAYTGAALMFDILPEEVYKNFLLLHVATYILLHPVLNKKYLHRARRYLRRFILSYEQLFGRSHVTLNIHALQHLPDDVERFTCLDRSSGYQFENFLGLIANLLRKGDKPLPQAVKRLAEKGEALFVKKKLQEERPVPSSTDIVYHQKHCTGPLIDGFTDPQYRRVVFTNRFTLCAQQVMGDSCIVTTDKNICLIQNFVTCIKTGENFVLVKQFLCKEKFFTYPMKSSKLGIYRVHSLSEDTSAVPVSGIKNKVVLVKAKEKGNFIAYPLLHSSF
ncbi:unnamed protein product [Bemisia tabaci]|uniref:Transposase domain-containing protein n=1 Tax=Bemisia tabaci TaxID=7038 RepID=A0A9P0ABY5_BEMTA|nr:unnamed protein product [Bemisia tabaci]